MDTLLLCADTDVGGRCFLSKKNASGLKQEVTQSFQSFGDPNFVYLREKP